MLLPLVLRYFGHILRHKTKFNFNFLVMHARNAMKPPPPFVKVNSKILESLSGHFSVLLLTQRVNIYVTVSGPTELQSTISSSANFRHCVNCLIAIFLQPTSTYDQQVCEHFIALQICYFGQSKDTLVSSISLFR